jgi:hypothetical protein
MSIRTHGIGPLLFLTVAGCSSTDTGGGGTQGEADSNSAAIEAVSPDETTAPPPPDSRTPEGPTREVVVNGVRLEDVELRTMEELYRLEIPDGDYWYDPILGAWGVPGSPALGLIAPGLDLGGPLQPDASGTGATYIFVNGRELHLLDVLALQSITGPILPGRYFLTSTGIAGFEGGPPLWDLGLLMAQAQGGGGGSTNWQSRVTGASGFSDGTSGAVFLPDGGIVSYGP